MKWIRIDIGSRKISHLDNITKVLPGHNELNVAKDAIEKIRYAFDSIEKNNLSKLAVVFLSLEASKYKYSYLQNCYAMISINLI